MIQKKKINKLYIIITIVLCIVILMPLFLIIVSPFLMRIRFANHTKRYFTALSNEDFDEASQYIFNTNISNENVQKSVDKWIDKLVELSDSGIVVEGVENIVIDRHDTCYKIRADVVFNNGDDEFIFSTQILPIPNCANVLTFERLDVPYFSKVDTHQFKSEVVNVFFRRGLIDREAFDQARSSQINYELLLTDFRYDDRIDINQVFNEVSDQIDSGKIKVEPVIDKVSFAISSDLTK